MVSTCCPGIFLDIPDSSHSPKTCSWLIGTTKSAVVSVHESRNGLASCLGCDPTLYHMLPGGGSRPPGHHDQDGSDTNKQPTLKMTFTVTAI